MSRARGGSHGAAVHPVDTQEPDVAPAQTGSDLAPKRFSKSDSNEVSVGFALFDSATDN